MNEAAYLKCEMLSILFNCLIQTPADLGIL